MPDLGRDERLLLLRFVCSFAWADGVVRAEERAFVARLARKLALGAAERREVDAWLADPPEPVDPGAIPREQRARFLHAAESVIAVDGEVAASERAQLLRLSQRLRGD